MQHCSRRGRRNASMAQEPVRKAAVPAAPAVEPEPATAPVESSLFNPVEAAAKAAAELNEGDDD